MDTLSLSGNLKLIVYCIFVFTCAIESKAQDYVKVTANEADIYTKSDLLVAQSINVQKGALFEVKDYSSDYVAIRMYSGVTRYLNKSEIDYVQEITSHPVESSVLDEFCKEIQDAYNIAEKKAIARYPRNGHKQSAYKNLLLDKYVLKVLQNRKIQTTHSSVIRICINDSLIGPIE